MEIKVWSRYIVIQYALQCTTQIHINIRRLVHMKTILFYPYTRTYVGTAVLVSEQLQAVIRYALYLHIRDLQLKGTTCGG